MNNNQSGTNADIAWNQPTSLVYSSVADPPSFAIDKYGEWRRAMMWWLGLNDGVDERRLLGAIVVSRNGLAKGFLQHYFDMAVSPKDSRPVCKFAEEMDRRFQRPSGGIGRKRIAHRARWRRNIANRPEISGA